mgnify:CR=1 FL=1
MKYEFDSPDFIPIIPVDAAEMDKKNNHLTIAMRFIIFMFASVSVSFTPAQRSIFS